MLPARFRECIDYLALTPKAFARMAEYDERLCRRWYSGTMAVPMEIDGWLESLVAVASVAPDPRHEWFLKADRHDLPLSQDEDQS